MKKERIKAQQGFRKSENTSFDESLYRPLVEKLSGDADAARIYGENLRHYRQRQGVTQEELANVIGVTNVGIHKIEAGKSKKINVDYLFLFCHHLGVHPRQLLPLEENLENAPSNVSHTAVDPMRFYNGIAIKKVKFVILQLWKNHPWMLYKLYLFSVQAEEYQNDLLTALGLTFLKERQSPSDNFFESYRPELQDLDILNPDISLLYKRIPEANKKGPYIPEEEAPAIAQDARKHEIYMDSIRVNRGAWEGYAIYAVYESAFENLMLTNSRLFAEFIKIASLNDSEKNRASILLNGCEI